MKTLMNSLKLLLGWILSSVIKDAKICPLYNVTFAASLYHGILKCPLKTCSWVEGNLKNSTSGGISGC